MSVVCVQEWLTDTPVWTHNQGVIDEPEEQSVGKELAVQAWGPKSRSPASVEKLVQSTSFRNCAYNLLPVPAPTALKFRCVLCGISSVTVWRYSINSFNEVNNVIDYNSAHSKWEPGMNKNPLCGPLPMCAHSFWCSALKEDFPLSTSRHVFKTANK